MNSIWFPKKEHKIKKLHSIKLVKVLFKDISICRANQASDQTDETLPKNQIETAPWDLSNKLKKLNSIHILIMNCRGIAGISMLMKKELGRKRRRRGCRRECFRRGIITCTHNPCWNAIKHSQALTSAKNSKNMPINLRIEMVDQFRYQRVG